MPRLNEHDLVYSSLSVLALLLMNALQSLGIGCGSADRGYESRRNIMRINNGTRNERGVRSYNQCLMDKLSDGIA